LTTKVVGTQRAGIDDVVVMVAVQPAAPGEGKEA
jgi:hypothetical protein